MTDQYVEAVAVLTSIAEQEDPGRVSREHARVLLAALRYGDMMRARVEASRAAASDAWVIAAGPPRPHRVKRTRLAVARVLRCLGGMEEVGQR